MGGSIPSGIINLRQRILRYLGFRQIEIDFRQRVLRYRILSQQKTQLRISLNDGEEVRLNVGGSIPSGVI